MRPFSSPRVAAPAPRHVVLFDGQCGLCRAGVARLRRWARPAAIEFRDFREPRVLAEFPGVGLEDLEGALHLILPGGRVVRGAEALARAALTRPLLGAPAWLYYVPLVRQLSDALYRLVARRRHRLSALAGLCTDAHCRVPLAVFALLAVTLTAAFAAGEGGAAAPVREGPRVQDPRPLRVGRLLPDAPLRYELTLPVARRGRFSTCRASTSTGSSRTVSANRWTCPPGP